MKIIVQTILYNPQKHLDQMQGNIITWRYLILWAKVQGVRCLLGTSQKNAVFCIHLLQCIEWNEDPEHTGTFCSMTHFHMW